MNETPMLVMKGSLEEFKLSDVLQVIGMSRQYTAIELQTAQGHPYGTIWIKAGHVIGARSTETQGKPAFRDMFGPEPTTFVVQRLPEPPSYPNPIGHLSSLVLDALQTHAPPRAEGSKVLPLPPTPQPGKPPPLKAPSPAAVRTKPRPLTVAPAQAVDDAWVESPTRNDGTITLAVVSPKGGVGKTTITLNLALSMAQQGVSTLVVDADVNGDIMSLLAARDRVERGVYDVLHRPDELASLIRPTAEPNLSIVPACGATVPGAAMARHSQLAAWRALLAAARKHARLVLIDCPAGMFGVTADVLGAASHAVGVVQSDMIASRSASMLQRGLDALAPDERPRLLGVVVNMFHGRSTASLEAFHCIATDAKTPPLFETTIPRSEAFAEASLAGVPLRFSQARAGGAPVSWLFDMLASEVCARAGLSREAGGATAESFVR